MTIWGKAASGGTYGAIAALTNIPATILAALFYEFVFTDSLRGMSPSCYRLGTLADELLQC
jgi:hypothetical protein